MKKLSLQKETIQNLETLGSKMNREKLQNIKENHNQVGVTIIPIMCG